MLNPNWLDYSERLIPTFSSINSNSQLLYPCADKIIFEANNISSNTKFENRDLKTEENVHENDILHQIKHNTFKNNNYNDFDNDEKKEYLKKSNTNINLFLK